MSCGQALTPLLVADDGSGIRIGTVALRSAIRVDKRTFVPPDICPLRLRLELLKLGLELRVRAKRRVRVSV